MYVLIEKTQLKTQYREFQEAVATLEQEAVSLAQSRWPGMTYGGFQPGDGQFGRTTILPSIFADENGDVLDANHVPTTWGVNEFRIYFSDTSPAAAAIPGWRTILQGGNEQAIGVMPEDVIVALAGVEIPDPSINFSLLKLEIGDKTHVKIDVEEAHGMERPAIIFEKGYVIEPEEYFRMRGFFQAEGYQRVIPLGFMLYRRKDFLIHE